MKQTIHSILISIFLCSTAGKSYCQLASSTAVRYDSNYAANMQNSRHALPSGIAAETNLKANPSTKQQTVTDSLPSATTTLPARQNITTGQKKNNKQ